MNETEVQTMISQDHDVLIEIRTQMTRLLQDMKELNATVTNSQEARLRVLENFRWWIMGAAAMCGALSGIIVTKLAGK